MNQSQVLSGIQEQHPEYATVKEFGDMLLAQWPGHLSGCGMTNIGLKDPSVPESEKEKVCIVVLLTKPLPDSSVIPQEYKGLRVFTELTGEIVLGY